MATDKEIAERVRVITRDTLLRTLRSQTGNAEKDQGNAENLLVAWLYSFDEEVGEAYENAAAGWWTTPDIEEKPNGE
jgi:hypothetical protein